MALTKTSFSMIDGETVNAKDFGFLVANTAAANKSALSAALATNKTVYIPSGTYQCDSGITVNLGIQSLLGDNVVIDMSGISGTDSGFVVTNTNALTPSDLSAPSACANKISGLIILGDGKAGSGASAGSTTIGLKIHSPHTSVEHCIVYGFGIGIDIYSNGYVQSYSETNIGQCAIGVNISSGGSDYGERISFVQCTIYDNILGISNNCQTGALQFTNCSIDYNTKTLVSTNSAITELHNCWWECNDAGSGNVVASLSGGSLLNIVGGRIQQNGTPGALAQDGFFDTNAATVNLENVFMFNLQNTANVLDAGSGAVWCNEARSYGVSYLPSKLAPVANNKLSDSGFETSTIADWWSLNEDTSAITNRFTGANITLALSSTYAHSGTKSLKITKTSGAANGSFSLVVPVTPGAKVAFTGWYKFPAASGQVYVTSNAGLINGALSNGLPSIGNLVSFDTLGIGNSGSPIDWTQFGTGMDRVVPSWANYYILTFNLYAFSGDLYLDDFAVHTM